jgi:SAM-dependent methyltransferase
MALYDTIGRSYAATRRPDPRIAAAVRAALGDARSVVNVGAGAGAYEPEDLDVLAVEPSAVMIAQRPPGSARVVQAGAERLPLEDGSVDAALAILTDHHWRDRPAGLRELRRVARRRVVLLNADPARLGDFWLNREYLTESARLIAEPYKRPGHWGDELGRLLGADLELRVVPVPHDCTDGFHLAYWRRPEAYLDPRVRANISVFVRLPGRHVDAALAALAEDLETGTWQARHRDLADRTELDLGLRLVIAELTPPAPAPAGRSPAPRAR